MSASNTPGGAQSTGAEPAAVVAATSTSKGPSSASEAKARKEAAKAAKLARRAADKANRGGTASEESQADRSIPRGSPRIPQSEGQQGSSTGEARTGSQQQQQQLRPRTQSQSQAQRPLPLRRRNSNEKNASSSSGNKVDKKEVSLFKHLYSSGTKNVSSDVHPAVLALGQQMSTYVICGSSARCVAMLLAFKQAIQSYTTPSGMALNRHLPSHYLGRQIEYLISRRPMSISMGNAIRWLKEAIGKLSIDLPESTAKAQISDMIDDFIQERITAADSLIARSAATKIHNGMTIVTFAKSHIVTRTLLHAHQILGLRFRTIVLDSRPLFEGRVLARKLSAAGLETTYALLNAAPHLVRGADLCLLGAHAMMANGRLCSRVGTASLALAAHNADVPVIALCESVKFSSRVALDSIVMNELAEPDELVLDKDGLQARSSGASPLAAGMATTAGTGAGVATGAGATGAADESTAVGGRDGSGSAGQDGEAGANVGFLKNWRQAKNLQLLNLMHDFTPADYIDMVITEYGSLPPTSVPVVFSISTGEHQQGR